MPLHRFAPFNNSLRFRSNQTAISTPDLRLYPTPCLSESNARRLLKRSQLSKKATREADDDEDTIVAVHEDATLEAVAAAAMSSMPLYSRPTGYSVQCYATHAEDAARRREAAETEREKLVLFQSINSSRHAEGQAPLRLKASLSKYAQDHADAISTSNSDSGLSPHPTTNNIFSTNDSSHTPHPNSVMVVMAPSGARVARLVSPPRMGALACGELWYGGKYRRHLYLSDKASAQHSDDCPCHLRMVFETMVDEGWVAIGIGRGEDGRWVVELGQ